VDLVVYDDDEQRYVPWRVALVALLLAALLTAALTFLLVRQASGAQDQQAVGGVSSPEPATAPSETPSSAPTSAAPTSAAPVAAPTQDPSCRDALLQADAALERSVAIDEALTKHTQIIDELLAERIDAQAALDQSLPVLTDGATERRRFQQDLQAYSQARQECPAS
jgi:hypothetical protein